MTDLEREIRAKSHVLFPLSILCALAGISFMQTYSLLGIALIVVFVPVTLVTYRLLPRKYNPTLTDINRAQISLLLVLFKHWKVALLIWVVLGLFSAVMFSS